ncbi:MAG: glycosyltransferase family 1 protein [Schleiferiaceae bacterium]
MNAKRIAFDAKRAFHNTSGLGNYGRDLIRLVHKALPESNLYLMDPEPERESAFHIDSQKVIRKGPSKFLHNQLSSYWRTRGMVDDLKGLDIQIFHGLSNELPRGLHGAGIKSVVTLHDLIFERYPHWYPLVDRKIYRYKSQHAVKAADRIIAISEQTADDLVTFYNVPREKIRVIYQGCHSAFKQTLGLAARRELREKFNLPERFVLNVGTVEPRKNAHIIAEALKDHPGVPLVIIGRPTPKYFSRVREALGPETPFIHLQGMTMEEVAGIYQLADLFVYPSTFEGFGIPIIEALFSHTPVITTSGGCFAEAGGPFSKYVPAGDVKALSQAIGDIWNHQETAQKMVSEGWEFVQKFRDDVLLNDVLSVYEELL